MTRALLAAHLLAAVLATSVGTSRAWAASAPIDDQKHPCKNLAAACAKAGFIESTSDKQKDIYHACMEPLLKGQRVSNVDSRPNDVIACRSETAAPKKM